MTLRSCFSLLKVYFLPLLTAVDPTLRLSPFLRLRLILFQPLALLSYTLTGLPHVRAPYTVHFSPTRSPKRALRYLRFLPPSPRKPKSVHITFHSGGFIGGLPEANAPFALHVSGSLDAIVLAPSYRFTPAHPFPAAVEDAEDFVRFALAHESWAGLPVTVSGFSAGGNLALGVTLSLGEELRRRIRAAALFYAPVDMRTPRTAKRIPDGFPRYDPIGRLAGGIIDTYAPKKGEAGYEDERLAPVDVEDLGKLPEKVLIVMPTVDVLIDEQERLAERLGRRARVWMEEGKWHGWLELPGMGTERRRVFGEVVRELGTVLKGSQ